MDTNKQNALADIEAMDMLKESLYETNNDTKRATEWSEDILECIDDDITNVLDKYIAKYYLSKDGNLFFEDDKILNRFEFALSVIQSLIKDTYNKPLAERKKEYKKNGLDDATCQTCDQYPYSETDNHCPICFVEIKSEVG